MSDPEVTPVAALAAHPRYRHADWDDLDRLAHSLEVVASYLDPGCGEAR